MRLVRGTKRILDAKQSITPRLVEGCLGLDREAISRRHGAKMVAGRKIRIPDTPGTFDIYCALPRIADRYAPHLQFLPSPDAKAGINTTTLFESLKGQYGRVRFMTEPIGGFVVYHSKNWPHRSVLYVFDAAEAEADADQLRFSGIVFARLHGH